MAKGYILLVAATLISAVYSDCGGYGAGHDMCLPAADCGRVSGVCGPVSSAEIETILTVHNNYRNKVAMGEEGRGAPGPQQTGTNISEMKWNQELADIAQRWAEQLVNGHDCSYSLVDGSYENTCRKTEDYALVGQNMMSSGSSRPFTTTNWEYAINSWISEVSDVKESDFSSPYGKVIGHYTQVVWAATNEIGCGRFANDELCAFKGWPSFYCITYFCNYGPPGNMMGSDPYSTTEKCSRYSSKYPALCSN